MTRELQYTIYSFTPTCTRDLGINVIAPFMMTDSDGNIYTCIAWIPHFGRPSGTVVFHIDAIDAIDAPDGAIALAKMQAYFWSLLNPTSYGRYDRQKFIDTLNDWAWFGDPAEAPSWYIGKPWN